MKKKIYLTLLLFISIFLIVGCNKSSNKNNNENTKNDTLEVKVDDVTVELDLTGSFNDLSFKYPAKATTMNVGTYYLMDYMNNDDLVVRVAIYRFENKTLDETMNGASAAPKGTKSYNERYWHIYEGTTDDGKNSYNYAYQYNNDTYTITFISGKNINDFIETFMNTITFKK